MPVTCPTCGQATPDDALVCSRCRHRFKPPPRAGQGVPDSLPAAEAQALLSRATILTNQGKAADGLALVDKVLEAFPRHHDAHLQRGTTLEALSRHDEAAEALRRASELKPSDVVALRRLGQALTRAGRPAEAIAAYDTALGLDLRSAQTWTDRAQSLLALGDAAGALESCERSLAVDPRHAGAKFTRAVCEERLGRPAEALRTYMQFLNLASPYMAELVKQARERVAALRPPG